MRPQLACLVLGALLSPAAAMAEMRDHADDVADYTLEARLDPATHVIDGTGTIRLRNTSRAPLRELWLHLYLNGFKDEHSLFMREAVDGRGASHPREWGGIQLSRLTLEGAAGGDLLGRMELTHDGDPDETDARVPLPHDIPPGETIELKVAFQDRLPEIVERTGFQGTFHMVGQWFPKLARLEEDGTFAHFPFHHLAEFYSDFGTYDVTIDVPEGYVIGATGPAVEVKTADGRRRERHVEKNIHDFAFAAWNGWTPHAFTVDGVAVTVLAPEGYGYVAGREAEAVRFGLRYFGEQYGRYPYTTLTVIHPPSGAEEAGGMEYPTLITTGGPWFGPPGLHVLELITLHELGHQWFYGLVATNESEFPWLDEGLNSFAEGDSLHALFGEGGAAEIFGFTVPDTTVAAAWGERYAHRHEVGAPARSFNSAYEYSGLVYDRTATLLETLLRVYGGEFREAMRDYATTYRYLHPGPEDFLRVLHAHLGDRAVQIARGALFERATVDYEVESVRSREVLVRRTGTLAIQVDVELLFSDGSSETVVWSAEKDVESIPYGGAKTLRGAIIDPEEKVLFDIDRANNQAALAYARGAGAGRSSEHLFYWANLLVRLFTR